MYFSSSYLLLQVNNACKHDFNNYGDILKGSTSFMRLKHHYNRHFLKLTVLLVSTRVNNFLQFTSNEKPRHSNLKLIHIHFFKILIFQLLTLTSSFFNVDGFLFFNNLACIEYGSIQQRVHKLSLVGGGGKFHWRRHSFSLGKTECLQDGIFSYIKSQSWNKKYLILDLIKKLK